MKRECLRLTPRDVYSQAEHITPKSLFAGAERKTDRENIWTYQLSDTVVSQASLGFSLDDLPRYMGIKGGAARQILDVLAHGDSEQTPPRDVDLVVLQEAVDRGGYSENQVAQTAGALSARFSPRDAMHGYGAEWVYSTEEFMDEHDFTINQVLVCRGDEGWELHATTQAILDTAEHVIRPTVYEHSADGQYRLSNKLALKAVRLLAEMQVHGVQNARIESVDLRYDTHGDPQGDAFMQALQLDKALENGLDVAEQYVENLDQLGILPYGRATNDALLLFAYVADAAGFDPSEAVNKLFQEASKDPSFAADAKVAGYLERADDKARVNDIRRRVGAGEELTAEDVFRLRFASDNQRFESTEWLVDDILANRDTTADLELIANRFGYDTVCAAVLELNYSQELVDGLMFVFDNLDKLSSGGLQDLVRQMNSGSLCVDPLLINDKLDDLVAAGFNIDKPKNDIPDWEEELLRDFGIQ